MRITEGRFAGFDGTELYYRTWLTTNPRATIVMTHGLGEHSGSYGRFAEGIDGLGINIFAWDLRGHGQSKGKRGVISKWSDYTQDLVSFVKYAKASNDFAGTFILSAHSMGGLVLLKALLDHGTLGASAFTLSSPLLGVAVQVPIVKRLGAHVLRKVAPKFTMANEIPNDHLTHDKSVIAEYEKDSLRHDRTSSVLYLEIVAAMEDVFARAGQITLPTIVQQAGADTVVSPAASKKLFPLIGSADKTWIEYPSFKHEIYNEKDRAKVFADLKPWLSKHIQS